MVGPPGACPAARRVSGAICASSLLRSDCRAGARRSGKKSPRGARSVSLAHARPQGGFAFGDPGGVAAVDEDAGEAGFEAFAEIGGGLEIRAPALATILGETIQHLAAAAGIDGLLKLADQQAAAAGEIIGGIGIGFGPVAVETIELVVAEHDRIEDRGAEALESGFAISAV